MSGAVAKSRPASMGRALERIEILGIGVDRLTRIQLLEKLDACIKSGESHVFSFANPEIIMLARNRKDYKAFLGRADLVLPDGIGLVWASRLLGFPLPERITGTDFMDDIAALSHEKGYRLFFLGGAPGIAAEAAEALARKYPRAKVVGCRHGYFSSEEEPEILASIKAASPDILVVCLGMYKQEMWISKNLADIRVPVSFGNGGALDFAAGRAKRAPKWMLDLGLEWCYRLLRQPSRIRRQAALPAFTLQVILAKLARYLPKNPEA